MRNLRNVFRQCVSTITLWLAYFQAVFVLLGAVVCSWFHRGFYNVRFIKVKNKWYCDVPGFPKTLFEHTMMVAWAANMLEYYSNGATELNVRIRLPRSSEYDAFCGFRLERTSATLTGGAFFNDPREFFTEEFWLCPITLFLLGRYPKVIYVYSVGNHPTHCPIFYA